MKESKRIVLSDKLKVNLYETLKNNRVAKVILELFYGVKWNMLHGRLNYLAPLLTST